jgi:hypothetical protein
MTTMRGVISQVTAYVTVRLALWTRLEPDMLTQSEVRDLEAGRATVETQKRAAALIDRLFTEAIGKDRCIRELNNYIDVL